MKQGKTDQSSQQSLDNSSLLNTSHHTQNVSMTMPKHEALRSHTIKLVTIPLNNSTTIIDVKKDKSHNSSRLSIGASLKDSFSSATATNHPMKYQKSSKTASTQQQFRKGQ